AEGGGHDPDRLVVLCGAHHRAVHDRRLLILGRYSTGFAFRHADMTEYGATVRPDAADGRALVFRALTSMGFKEGPAPFALCDGSSKQRLRSLRLLCIILDDEPHEDVRVDADHRRSRRR